MIDIFAGVAISSTNTYKSTVTKATQQRCLYVVSPTGTATGTLKREINFLDDRAYEAAVAAASGSTRAEKEAANTTGWVDQSFLQSDVTNSGATLAINGTATFTADMPPVRARTRLSYTNATNSGTMRVFLALTAD